MTQAAAAAQGFDPERLDRLRAAIQGDVDAERMDGAVVIIARRGEVVFEDMFGFADRATGRPMTVDAVFHTMSVAKPFTNITVLQAVDRGRVALTTPVSDVIPEFAVHGKGAITVGDLIIHKAGLSSGVPPVPPEKFGDLASVVAAVSAMPPETTPGTVINYSPACAHAILAEVVRRVDGGARPYRRILAEDVFTPLGMTDTALGLRPDLSSRRVPVVYRDRSPGLFDPDGVEGAFNNMGADDEIPAGGCLTTAGDVLRFAEAMRRGGALDGRRVLSPAILRLATTNQTGDMPNLLWAYAKEKAGWPDIPAFLGMGFFLRGAGIFPMPFGIMASEGAFGGLGAGSTMFWVDPVTEVTCVFLSAGLLEEVANVRRLQRLSDLIHSAIER